MNDETKTTYTLVKYRPSWPAREHFLSYHHSMSRSGSELSRECQSNPSKSNRIIANHILPRSKAEEDDEDREDISSSLSCREYFSPVSLLASVAAL